MINLLILLAHEIQYIQRCEVTPDGMIFIGRKQFSLLNILKFYCAFDNCILRRRNDNLKSSVYVIRKMRTKHYAI